MALTQEQQIIFDAVIASLRTNSKTIEDLTPQTSLGSNDWFELNGGRKVSYAVLSALIKSLSSTDHDSYDTRINKNVLKAVSFDVSESAATLTVESNGKTVSCSVPVATATASGIITALDKVKIQSAYENAQAAQASADAAQENAQAAQASADAAQKTADAAKTAAQGAQGALKPLNDRVIAMGNTVSGHTTAISNLTEIVDGQYTALQGCHEIIGTNDAKIDSIGIVPFDGLYDADNLPTTGVWFRRYGADEGGTCVMWSADGEFPAGFSEQDYNVTFHGVEYIRTDRVFRTDNRLYRFDGNGLVEVGRDPRQVFNDMWDAAFGEYGKYDPANAPDAEHPYLGNGIWMSYEEALDIYVASANVGNNNSYSPRNCFFGNRKIRTVLPIFNSVERTEWYQAFKGCVSLEAVSGEIHVYRGTSMFVYCHALRNVSTIIFEGTGAVDYMFQDCRSLESVEIRNLMANISFGQSPKLSLASIEYMVNNRYGSAAITITLHPTAYARVTDELFALAAEKDITIAST